MSSKQTDFILDPHPAGPLAMENSGETWGVLMLHGFSSGPYLLRGWAEKFAELGAVVSAPLLPGHGTTEEDFASSTAHQWRTAVRQATDELAAVVDRLVIAGISMGGTLALDVAAHRDVEVVFLVNPALSFRPLDTAGALLSPMLKHLIPSVGSIADDIAKPGVTEHAYARTPVSAVEQLAKLFIQVNQVIPQVQAPIYVYRSAQDGVVPDSSVSILQRNTLETTVEVIPLPRSKHVALLDYDAPTILEHSAAALTNLAGVNRGFQG